MLLHVQFAAASQLHTAYASDVFLKFGVTACHSIQGERWSITAPEVAYRGGKRLCCTVPAIIYYSLPCPRHSSSCSHFFLHNQAAR